MVTATTPNARELQTRRESVRFVGAMQATDPRLTDGLTPSELESKLAEMLLIERYKDGDLSLGEVTELLGLYPDVEGALKWLNRRGVVQEMAPGERAQSRAVNQRVLEAARARLAANQR